MASRALPLFVEAVHQHRDLAAEMGHDEFNSRVTVGDLLSDHMQHESRILERGADRPPSLHFKDGRFATQQFTNEFLRPQFF